MEGWKEVKGWRSVRSAEENGLYFLCHYVKKEELQPLSELKSLSCKLLPKF